MELNYPIKEYKPLINKPNLSKKDIPLISKDKLNLNSIYFEGTFIRGHKYSSVEPIPPSTNPKYSPYLDSIRRTMEIILGTATREQRYRIGTIGETPIEVTVSYKPADALSKLLKVEL